MSTDRLTSRTVSSAISAKHPSRADKEGYLPLRRSQAQTSCMLDECMPAALLAAAEFASFIPDSGPGSGVPAAPEFPPGALPPPPISSAAPERESGVSPPDGRHRGPAADARDGTPSIPPGEPEGTALSPPGAASGARRS